MSLKLRRGGYEPLLDYMKGIAILMVLVTHGAGEFSESLLYPLWIDQAVPLFLLIQVFHVYKKDSVCHPALGKLWKRIVRPFVFVQCLFLIYFVLKHFLQDADLKEDLWHMFTGCGGGPGSYYPWIYLQMAFLCPLLYRLAKSKHAFWGFAALCIVCEVVCSLVELHDRIYRVLCFRYIFLIYLGYLWVKHGIVLNKRTMALSVVSIVAILTLSYVRNYHPECNFEPLVFDSAWTTCHWFTYFLVWSLLAFVICRIYKLKPQARVNQLILLCGKRSYEIFLFQMLVFSMVPLPGWACILISLLPVLFYEWKAIIGRT